ncbi:MAG: hypothetical protein K2Y56_07570 [Methylobacterium sp.]|uniref:hypothetical protein n=1 Tax=Methylobacterium sp. TaxID=409 RepID=UPI0025DA5D8E|nr:hypothetical protein [Methylobacterium sp.]MBX9931382.1 hypothetical protein [Methylobacterium sp.]
MKQHEKPVFVAYASRLQALAVTACFLPVAAAGFMNLVLLPGAPIVLRIVGLLILAPILVWFGISLKLFFLREPLIEIDERGVLWRRWSQTRIPWAEIERWRVGRTFGLPYVTIWLREPDRHPARTVNGLLRYVNRLLGYGDLTLSANGTDKDFPSVRAAMEAYGPIPSGRHRT